MEDEYRIVTGTRDAKKEITTIDDLSSIQVIRHTLSLDTVIGRILFEIKNHVVYIRELWVQPEARGQGIGSQLMRRLDQHARLEGCRGVAVNALIPINQKDNFLKFMLTHHYSLPESTECIMDVDIKTLKNSWFSSLKPRKTTKRLVNMTQLPPELDYDYRKRISPHIVQGATLGYVKGRLLPELSLALADDSTIAAYVIFSELEGQLYLNGVYLNNENTLELITLLQCCMNLIEKNQNRWDTLKVTLISPEGYHLFTSLCAQASIQMQLVYHCEKLL